jgi:hypothetical protein
MRFYHEMGEIPIFGHSKNMYENSTETASHLDKINRFVTCYYSYLHVNLQPKQSSSKKEKPALQFH